jgi:hypothetical protein
VNADDPKPEAKPAVKPAVVKPAVVVKKAEPKKAEVSDEEKEYQKQAEAQKKLMSEMTKSASHQTTKEIKVLGSDKVNKLQTLAVTADDRVLALVAPARGYGASVKDAAGEVQVYSLDGNLTDTWKVNFHAHSVAAAPDGVVYVAGDGKVARIGKDGKAIGEPVELPHVTEMFKDKDAMRKKAEADLKAQNERTAEAYKSAKKQFEDKAKKLEEIKAEDRSKAEQRQLDQAKQMIELYDKMAKDGGKTTVDDFIKTMTGRVRIINGIAVNGKDVFIACGETGGYGYSIWRFNRDLGEPKQILKGLGGCCGQMDVQCCGSEIVIAENTKHQFAKYDRDGKKIASFGKRGVDTDPSCFGGCCNPMNTRAHEASGDIYTAESEGVVKRFSGTGAFINVAGTVSISGGCKNVAIGVSGDGEKIVFCDQPGSKILILSKKSGDTK